MYPMNFGFALTTEFQRRLLAALCSGFEGFERDTTLRPCDVGLHSLLFTRMCCDREDFVKASSWESPEGASVNPEWLGDVGPGPATWWGAPRGTVGPAGVRSRRVQEGGVALALRDSHLGSQDETGPWRLSTPLACCLVAQVYTGVRAAPPLPHVLVASRGRAPGT